MTPAFITEAIKGAGGTIEKCEPVCEGSKHFIVTFTAPPEVARIEGAASLAPLGGGRYRAQFITPEK